MFSPSQQTDYPIAPKPSLQIALFGTSADPPNIGHRKIVCWLSQHFDRVAVWASDNPLKSQQTPIEHRSKMLQLMLEELKNTSIDSQPDRNIEMRQDLSSPRALTSFEKARSVWEDADFTFVIGSDLVPQIPQWYCAIELLQQVQLLIVPRPGFPIADSDLEKLKQLTQVTIAPLQMPDVSSTAYRNTKDDSTIVPPVAKYINRERLY
jgi:nicotinate-nucleotide adenylyltransferase